MEKTFKIRCEDPDQFRYWLERQVRDADQRSFPVKGGGFTLEWPRVEGEEPLRMVMDGVYTYDMPMKAEGYASNTRVRPNVIAFELREASPPWMGLVATYDADMPAARTYFESLLDALTDEWETQAGAGSALER